LPIPARKTVTLRSTIWMAPYNWAPSLLQPDGSVYRFGTTPPRGTTLWFSRYEHGGGVKGTVPKGALSVIKSSIPYIAYVVNREPAVGGHNTETLADAMIRAPRLLRTWSRAVTASDYEHLACEAPGVARAYCMTGNPRPHRSPSRARCL
jgi:predicted phage baseplate assembly protein